MLTLLRNGFIQRSSISVVRVFGAIHCPLARTLIDAKIPNFSHFARITLIQCACCTTQIYKKLV